MAKFLTTRGTTSEIENIINNATNVIVLMSPFIKIPESLFQNIKAADNRGMKLTLVYGKKALEPDVINQLKQLKNIKLRYLENLHGKCYFNEKSMVITSLNLYDFSEQNNRELGVLITREDDGEVFTDAVREARMIISLANHSTPNGQVQEKQVKPEKIQKPDEKEKTKSFWHKDLSEVFSSLFGDNHCFCIGCRTKIEFDEYRPYCPDCYGKWKKHKWQKADYCHKCGQESATTINKPLCQSCFEKAYH
jgi:phosphatidylserine/phosphatidylglycerophosphate/cardiolipin synthase-like enzyme